MSSSQIFADEIAALMPDTRIARLRDEQDIHDLAALLATAFGVGTLQVAIAAALAARRSNLGSTGRHWCIRCNQSVDNPCWTGHMSLTYLRMRGEI